VFSLDVDGNPVPLIPNPGPPEAPCAGSALGDLFFDVAPGIDVFATFGGFIHVPNPGPPETSVYAFATRSSPGSDPGSAPYLLLGTLGPGGSWIPGGAASEFPLYAVASPGTEVGTLQMTLEAVPEPGVFALAVTGLAALSLRRRRR
jgi:hypothetical protein